MFIWESSHFFCRRLVKLLESVIQKMIELKLCNDPKHPVMYTCTAPTMCWRS